MRLTQNQKIGVALIAIGILVLFSALPWRPMAMVDFSVGPASVRAMDITSTSATIITIGGIIIITGLACYFGKVMLKR